MRFSYQLTSLAGIVTWASVFRVPSFRFFFGSFDFATSPELLMVLRESVTGGLVAEVFEGIIVVTLTSSSGDNDLSSGRSSCWVVLRSLWTGVKFCGSTGAVFALSFDGLLLPLVDSFPFIVSADLFFVLLLALLFEVLEVLDNFLRLLSFDSALFTANSCFLSDISLDDDLLLAPSLSLNGRVASMLSFLSVSSPTFWATDAGRSEMGSRASGVEGRGWSKSSCIFWSWLSNSPSSIIGYIQGHHCQSFIQHRCHKSQNSHHSILSGLCIFLILQYVVVLGAIKESRIRSRRTNIAN